MSKAAERTENPAVAARGLIRAARSAALATALTGSGAGRDGWPYASLVTVASDCDGSPILLLSGLSDHTRNVAADPRASLLFEAASRRKNPQTGPRVTVMGRIKRTAEARHARRFLARHPDAAMYAEFADFHFYRMTVDRAHYVGGFGKAHWIKGKDVTFDAEASEALAEIEPGVIEHMNADHADAVDLYANVLLGRRGVAWSMIAVDPEGADLRRGHAFARLEFDAPVHDSPSCREALVSLAIRARDLA